MYFIFIFHIFSYPLTIHSHTILSYCFILFLSSNIHYHLIYLSNIYSLNCISQLKLRVLFFHSNPPNFNLNFSIHPKLSHSLYLHENSISIYSHIFRIPHFKFYLISLFIHFNTRNRTRNATSRH
jgi:hypothetical protein